MSHKTFKHRLRRTFLSKRVELSEDLCVQKSQEICHHLQVWLQTQQVDVLCGYAPVRHEVDIMPLLHGSEPSVKALPVVGGSAFMDFCLLEGQPPWSLQKNSLGITEPVVCSVPILPTSQTVLCVPCVAVDHLGYRLGYGGGYYDRYLRRYPWVQAIGVVYEFQWVEALPHDLWDVRLQGLCHEKGLVWLGA